jgi:branched-chain amino acid transport system permease protein
MMSASLLLQAVVAGVTNGFVYGLVGIGLAAIFKGSRIINVMQGDCAVVGAITTVLLLTVARWPYWLAMLAGAAAGAILCALTEVLFVRRMVRKQASEDDLLLLTVGIATSIGAALLFFVGRKGYLLPPLGGETVLIVRDAVVQGHAVWLVAIATVMTLALRSFYRHSTIGLAMIAASNDADGAATTGINVTAMRTLTFALGGLLGAIAGILVTPLIAVDYQMGLSLTLKGFAAAILGGLTNPLGAIVGGLTLGLLEALAIVWVSSAYKDVVAFSFLIAIMILRPQGILGRSGRQGG